MQNREEQGTARSPLTTMERLAILWRSFLLQSVWNTRGMQNVGFCFAMLALTRRYAGDRAALRDFVLRHLGFFNTNPALASYALGATARAEAAGQTDAALDVKRSLAGPLGMAGDALFWGALRPFAGLVGVVLALGTRSWAPVLLVAVYNSGHLFFRVRGIWAGASQGTAAVREVVGSRLKGVVTCLRAGGAFLGGYAVALGVTGPAGLSVGRVAAAGGVLVLAYVAARLRVPTAVVAFGAALGGVLAMALG